jgi:transposase
MFTPFLLPEVAGLQVEQVEADASLIALTVAMTAPVALCPVCRQPSHRVQSRYLRTIADVPWAGVPVRLQLHVRRFVCGNPECQRAIFCERLGPAIRAYARRTKRLEATVELLGFAVGGEAGARLLTKLGMAGSPTTVLRMLRGANIPDRPTPRVLGVDDWAWCKGRSYGAILCDLEQHQVVDLLPNRLAETFAAWLRRHPGVEVISRDRASGFAEGARAGAPQAIQVADRWHLLRNLAETLELLVRHHHSQRKPEAKVDKHQWQDDHASVPQARLTPAQQRRREQRQACYLQVHALYEQSWSLQAIAHEVGIDRGTVAYFVRHQAYPEYKPSHRRRSRGGQLDTYLPYLHERWNAGCHNGMKLWRELRERGYTGSASSVRPYIALLRQAPGQPLSQGSPFEKRIHVSHRSPQQVAWLVLRPVEHLTDKEQTELALFCQEHAEVSPAILLAQSFASMVRDRSAEALDDWVTEAQASPFSELRTFATGVARDKAAVTAAMTRAESNGQVEGHITRLKLIKRQMYGRAKFDLLRQRVLHAA